MIFQEGELQFEFKGAMEGIKFDESDKTNPNFHGLSHCMKAVDFIVEMERDCLFVEVKDFPVTYAITEQTKHDLIKSLVAKFRDTFLYRWAEEKMDKPVTYLCLLELDNALVSYIMKELKRQLPECGPPSRWKKSLTVRCIVANVNRWNCNFPDWPVQRITGGPS